MLTCDLGMTLKQAMTSFVGMLPNVALLRHFPVISEAKKASGVRKSWAEGPDK